MIDSNDQCVHTQTSIIRVKLTYTLYYQATATYVTVFSEVQQPAYDCPTTFAVQVEEKPTFISNSVPVHVLLFTHSPLLGCQLICLFLLVCR